MELTTYAFNSVYSVPEPATIAELGLGTSAANDPSVSQSVFTITEKAPSNLLALTVALARILALKR